ncbi:MAG: DNA polymerase III subunit delta [Nevskiaceae bacterium]|nr:MAG: DNA polymerase III subunit delta [Nevskiaceae bacterium]
MRLNAHQLAAHLAKGLAPVYVVAGEEPLLVQEALDAIRAAARRQGYSEREVLDADKSFDWQRVVDACASLSLFASRRIVEIRLPSGAPGVEGGKVLTQLAKAPPPDVLLLLTCEAIDWRSRQGGWYSAIENGGAALYFEPMPAGELPNWLAARARAAGVELDAEALTLLAQRTEGNLLAAAQDVEKLKLLFPGQRISAAELEQAVADSARYEAFDFIALMQMGDAAGAVRSLARLREEGVEVLEILGALLWSLRSWIRAQAIYAQTGDAGSACQQAGVPRKNQPQLARALARTRVPQLYGWLRRCAAIDSAAKSTGGKEQAWEELLTLTLAASGAAPRRTP